MNFFRFNEIVNRDGVEFIPGGATQNVLRVFQVNFLKLN